MNLFKYELMLRSFLKGLILSKRDNHEKELRRHQLNDINYIVNYAYNNTYFYRNFYHKQIQNGRLEIESFKDFEKCPVLKKKIFKASLKEGSILSSEFKRADLISGKTTGSTGEPMTVFFDKPAMEKRLKVLSQIWYSLQIRSYHRLAKIWRRKSLNESEQKLFDNGLFLPLSVGDFSSPKNCMKNQSQLHSILQSLISFNPVVIRGYVSALYTLSKMLKVQNIRLPVLKSVIASAEYLPEKIWTELEECFGCPVYNLYGGTEVPAIAVSSKDSRNLKISEDLYYIEVLDEQDRPVAPGVPGAITITDLSLKGMPLIRYQIGDMAIIDDNFYKFGSEFRYFKSVIGRTNDIFEFENGEIVYSHIWHVNFWDEDWIDQFKVIQVSRSKIDIQLVLTRSSGFPHTEKNADFKKRIAALFPHIMIEWKTVDKIELGKGSKFQSVLSMVPNKFNLINKL